MRRRALLSALGGSGKNEISFKVSHPDPDIGILEFKAINGMTWEEWCNSEYNYYIGYDGIMFEILGNYVYEYEGGFELMKDGVIVLATDEVIADSTYSAY